MAERSIRLVFDRPCCAALLKEIFAKPIVFFSEIVYTEIEHIRGDLPMKIIIFILRTVAIALAAASVACAAVSCLCRSLRDDEN